MTNLNYIIFIRINIHHIYLEVNIDKGLGFSKIGHLSKKKKKMAIFGHIF